MKYEYENTFETGLASDVNILDRVLTEDGTLYVNWGHSLFVEVKDTNTRIKGKDLEGDLKIQRIRSRLVKDFRVNDHFVFPVYC